MMGFYDFNRWYYDLDVQYNMIKFTKDREMMVMSPKHFDYALVVRNLKCHSVQHFQYIVWGALESVNRQRVFQFYYSLARFMRGLPNQNLKDMKQRKEDNKEFEKDRYRLMSGFDFLIDIDVDSHSQIGAAYYSAKRIKDLFDYHGVPYELRFSGCGFHFLIPSRYQPELSFDPKQENNIYRYQLRIANFLFKNHSELIDLSVYDSKRVTKIPYSLAIYPKKLYVCYPFLDHDEFNNFELDQAEPINFTVNNRLKDRGTFIFNEGGSLRSLEKHIGGKLKW